MKKIVGTILAASLVFGAFAADPAANFVMSDFSGNAGFGWKADFADSENVKMGMFNSASANLKFGFVKGGDKVTTGDGIWGELKIKAGDADATAIPSASVDTAKIHLVNGDFSAALNILKPSIKYDGIGVSVAAPAGATYTEQGIVPAATDLYKKSRENLENEIGKDTDTASASSLYGKLAAANAALETAKKTPSVLDVYAAEEAVTAAQKELDAAKAALDKLAAPAAGDVVHSFGTAGIGDDTGLSAGFGIELAMDNMFALNIKLMDNAFSPKKDAYSLAKDKKFGMAIDAALLFHKPLTFKVNSSFNFDTGYIGLQLNTGYDLAINDKLYVKPVFGYEMVKKSKNTDELSNAIVAGALFGWGAKDAENTLDFFGDKKKFNEGVSFAITPVLGLKNKTLMLMSFSMYDQSLFNLLGLSDFGTLKTAFAYDLVLFNNKDTKYEANNNTIKFAVAYDKDFDVAYVNVHGGVNAVFGKNGSTEVKPEPAYKAGLKLGTKTFIDNTDLYVGFELEGAKKVSKSELTVGTSISF